MLKLLAGLVTWALSGMIARLLVGAGLTIITATALTALVSAALDGVGTSMGGLPAAAFQLALLGGVAEFLSIIGSALLTRAAMRAAMAGLGLKTT